ncbi:MAG TPA: YceI family protein [Oleiagrimonas sp.]|nr:YceI family protein [Oleiagrimonas sp.]
MKRLLILLLLCIPAVAMGKTWQVDQAHSTLGFDGSFQGQAFHGQFKHFNADITFDPADLSTARFDVLVNLASVDTQSAERDQALTGSDFFAVSQYPKAHFVTRSFSKGADGQVVAHGTLTLRGISQPVDLKVDFKPGHDGATLDIASDVSRLDWKLGASDDWNGISKQIHVRAHLILH